MQEEDLKGVPLLVLANKQDLAGAMTAEQISDTLGLISLKNRQWQIQKASAVQGVGLYEGLDWIINSIKARS